MFWPLKCSKYDRLVQNEEEFEDVQTEINLIFNPGDTKKFLIANREYHLFQIIHESHILFKIASKLLAQAEDILELETVNLSLNETSKYVLDFLKATRSAMFQLSNSQYKDIIYKEYTIFKMMLIRFTDMNQSTLMKLIGSTKKQSDTPILQYLHLYMNVLWIIASIDEDLTDLITQLSFLSYKSYECNKQKYITCNCFSTLWLLIQIYCERKQFNFWETFNAVMECHDEEFSITFTIFIANLQRFNITGVSIEDSCSRIVENYDFFNRKWNSFLKNNNPDESIMFQHMKQIENLVTNLWTSGTKLDLLYASWDYFYKRIEIIPKRKSILKDLTNLLIEAENAYLYFLRILNWYFDKYPQRWNKFRGRIYTRFTGVKFTKLNDNGIQNLALLFICIVNVNFEEISSKLLGMLEGLPIDRQNTEIVWDIYTALIHLYLRNNIPIDEKFHKFLQLIQDISTHRPQYRLISHFVNNLNDIFKTGNLNLNQNILLGSWIETYSKSCSHSELSSLLNTLLFISEKINENSAWFHYEQAFTKNIWPSLKRIAIEESPIELTAIISTFITFNIPTHTIATASFFASESVSPVLSVSFFKALFKLFPYIHPINIDQMILKAWFQCSLIEETSSDFTEFVFKLNLLNFKYSNETFKDFLVILKKSCDKELIKICFNTLDKWLLKQISTNNEWVTQEIYASMGRIFDLCGNALYNRSTPNCYLSKIIDLLLLNTDIMRGMRPNKIILDAIEMNWHIFVMAIYNLPQGDPYLERVLKDLFIKYIPHFQTNPTPLLRIAHNEDLFKFALSKISNEFLLQGVNNRCSEENLFQAISTVHNLIVNCKELNEIQSIISYILPGLFEVYMFKNQKVSVIEFIKVIVNKDFYKAGQLSVSIKRCLIDATKKHLPFNTHSYFTMIYLLCKLVKAEVKGVLDNIKDEIGIVEAKRAQRFDNNLRQGFDKLQKLLN